MGCTSKQGCSYAFSGSSLACKIGGSGCSFARFAMAKVSNFHDEALAEANAKIKAIIDALPQEKEDGRTLSIINTEMGNLLVWVRHDGEDDPDAITNQNSDKEVIKALGLKVYESR